MNRGYSSNNGSLFSGVDWTTVGIYIALVFMGWITIFAAVYNDEHAKIFDISQQYGAQLIWIGISFTIATTILLIDDRNIHALSYPAYIFTILILISVLFLGTEVNGARSWFQIGPFRLQPAEFAKFTTGLALAKYISSYGYNIKRFKNIAITFMIAMLPALIIIAQNDTGSALVYGSFLIMFYREGFSNWVYLLLFIIISLFVSSFLFESWIVILMLFILLTAIDSSKRYNPLMKLSLFGAVMLLWVLITMIDQLCFDNSMKMEYSLILSTLLIAPFVVYSAFKSNSRNTIVYVVLFFLSSAMVFSVDFVFNNALKIHQQKRILDTLGLENDTKGWGYNVNQSKIAIGSGGFWGKGFLNGTQTKYNFVPEQSTDFIFCTIGEEWGFVGSVTVVLMFIVLILRLMRMGDNQRESFSRVYCYFVASVLTFHVLINIGMTIGIMPVVGIPLPFFSYGGSSLMSFTILLFIAIRLDSRNNEIRQ